MRSIRLFFQSSVCAVVLAAVAMAQDAGLQRPLRLTPGKDNPRNSEGDFVQLKDGRLMFVYTHFTGSSGSDHAKAHLAARFSADGGQTWTADDVIVVPNEGDWNVVSV